MTTLKPQTASRGRDMSTHDAASAEVTGHVIFTTHWDREWVQGFEQYRFRLVNLMDRLLDILDREPALRFLLDGQAVVLDDYLAVRQEQRPRLEALGRAGRLIVGPWYILADQFLECDEATVRNLQLGFRLSQPFGGPMMHGYVPDSFGSVAALPSILNGFGIRHANVRHGRAYLRDIDTPVARWRGPDGAELLTLFRGYGEAIDMTYPNQSSDISIVRPTLPSAMAAANGVIAQERALMPVSHVYLSTGADHMPMRPDMSGLLESLNRSMPGVRFVVSNPLQCLRAIEAAVEAEGVELETIEGEMRGEKRKPLPLYGTLTTNALVKRLNRACEILCYRVLEPLAAVLASKTGENSNHILDHVWKLLIQSHAHDSICACSRDEVVAEIVARFEKVRQLYAVASERWMRRLFPSPPFEVEEHPAVVLFNTMPWRGRDVVRMLATVPTRLTKRWYELVNGDNEVVGHAQPLAVRRNDMETFFATAADLVTLECKRVRDERLDRECYTVLDVTAEMDFGQAAAFHKLRLRPAGRPAPAAVTAGDREIASDRVAVRVAADGSIELEDRSRGVRYGRLCWLEDTAECGDTYRHVPLAGDRPIVSESAAVKRCRVEGRGATLEVVHTLNIPNDSTPDGRSGRCTRHRVSVVLTVHAAMSVVTMRVRMNNKAVHHRLRLGMRFDDRPAVRSGGHFGVLARQWTEPDDPCAAKPMVDFLHVDVGSGRGLCVMTKGLYEFEARARPDGHGDLFITLLRSVDMIGPGAGCNYPVEHAKELGHHEMGLAIALTDSLDASIDRAAAFTTPVPACGAIVNDSAAWRAPDRIVEIDNPRLHVSCLKPAADGAGVVVRCVNPHDTGEIAAIRLHLPYDDVQQVDLSERALRRLVVDEHGWASFHARAFETVTVAFRITREG